jgi:hypothetical protein
MPSGIGRGVGHKESVGLSKRRPINETYVMPPTRVNRGKAFSQENEGLASNPVFWARFARLDRHAEAQPS